mmetsp:Transcript_121077/g.189950  ORF Transcript_121077/g.189950 Transcript_121077/m.189950 type:complete len:564 (-) Transcript_121077:68-1759(-)
MTMSRPAIFLSVAGLLISCGLYSTAFFDVHIGVDSEKVLMAEFDTLLGDGGHQETEMRLQRTEKVLRPMFAAMASNTGGLVGNAAASYMLHRSFLQRYAWSITTLEPTDGSFSSWSMKSPISILEGHAPEDVVKLFRQKFGGKSTFDLADLTRLAAAFEDVVHREALLRLGASYISHSMRKTDILGQDEVVQVLETFMAIYILGNGADTTARQATELRETINESYPAWAETQEFLREVYSTAAPKREYMYVSEVEKLLSDVGERYGQFQNKECQEFKDLLVAVEDQGVGGAGRVRLADFYNMSLNGKWQFSEQRDYLKMLGALDDSDASNPRVIIPNYINSYANCAASSRHYKVCCLDECESILAALEEKVAAPHASSDVIIDIVSSISSATVSNNRTIAPWLRTRLDEVAAHHGGVVPLHGRLFAQWLHYAYPRECQFPHAFGTINPQRPEDILEANPDATDDIAATPEVMKQTFAEALPPKQRIPGVEVDATEESGMWRLDEELVVWHIPAEVAERKAVGVLSLRGAVFFGVVVSLCVAIRRSFSPALVHLQAGPSEKYFV